MISFQHTASASTSPGHIDLTSNSQQTKEPGFELLILFDWRNDYSRALTVLRQVRNQRDHKDQL